MTDKFIERTPKDVALVDKQYTEAKRQHPWIADAESMSMGADFPEVIKRRIWLNNRIDNIALRVAARYSPFNPVEQSMLLDLLAIVHEINNA